MDTASSLCWASVGLEVVHVSVYCHCLYYGAAVVYILAWGFVLGVAVLITPNLASREAEGGRSQGQGQSKKDFLEGS